MIGRNIKNQDICPFCQEGELERARRKNWMRWFHSSRLYRCNSCRARFLAFRTWHVRLTRGKEKPWGTQPKSSD